MNKWERREKKKRKRQYGMKVSGKSVFVIKDQIAKRAKHAKQKREEQNYWFEY